jgi:hypothetical protein
MSGWSINTVTRIVLLDIIQHSVPFVTEYFGDWIPSPFWVENTQLDPIDRASFCLRTFGDNIQKQNNYNR